MSLMQKGEFLKAVEYITKALELGKKYENN